MTEKFLGEEDNSQMCKTCKHLKQRHKVFRNIGNETIAYYAYLYCVKKEREMPRYLHYCSRCEKLFAKCKTYQCYSVSDIFHSCPDWELDPLKKKQSEMKYHKEQLALRRRSLDEKLCDNRY